MKNIKYFTILLMFGLVGCASLKTTDISEYTVSKLKLYQLYIDEDGNLLDPVSEDVVTNEADYIDDIYRNFEQEKKKNKELKLTIFIHGGLNTFKSSTARVKEIKNTMLKDNKYPLFISWNSGPLTNYFDHLFIMRNGEKSPVLGAFTSPFLFLEDVLRSVIRIPESTFNILFGQNSIFPGHYTDVEKASDKALSKLIEKKFKIYDSKKDNWNGMGDWWSVWNPIKLITSPFVDGLGSGTWDSMLRRTDLVLRKDKTFDGEEDGDTAVSKFFNKFPKNNKITIIGHSMGTIIANNIIVRYPELKFSNIVYMAAACKIKDLESIIAPYLHENIKSKFYNLSLNPYRDISENTYYDFAPRGSLLMWIDLTLGDINSFQDRTAGYWYNIIRGAGEAFKHGGISKRVHLTQFGVDEASPKKHGDFGDFHFWDENFWKGEIITDFNQIESANISGETQDTNGG